MKGFRVALAAVIKAGTKVQALKVEWKHSGSSFCMWGKGMCQRPWRSRVREKNF